MTGLEHSGLLVENLRVGETSPDEAVLHELTHLALTQEQMPHLTAALFETLRRVTGQDAGIALLDAIQVLAAEGTPAGSRLLAAFLNVAAPCDRLLPLVTPLDSTRRFATQLLRGGVASGASQSDWQRRMIRSVSRAASIAKAAGIVDQGDDRAGPRQAAPWPMLRGVLQSLLADCHGESFWQEPEQPEILAEMLRLEIAAWQERVSNLAGNINPFNMVAVQRILPMLNRADADIRDLRQMAGWIAERDYETAFVVPQARWRETLDEKDWSHLLRELRKHTALTGLRQLAEGLNKHPVPLPQFASGVKRVVDLSHALVGEGVRNNPLNNLTAAMVVQSHYRNGQIVLTVDKDLTDAVSAVLPDPTELDHPLAGLSLLSGLLIFDLDPAAPERTDGLLAAREMTEAEETGLLRWRAAHGKLDPAQLEALREQGLANEPTADDEDSDEDEVEVEDLGAAALKHLVMQNIQSVSVLLGFLRNPKITGIPGLVEEVVNRTRNPQIVSTIAQDRALYTGFANKGVPLACLRSPVNVSVKTLRKFCHVKYVAKIELKRMANDRTGIRKEVAREIAKYLEALA